MPTPPTTSNHDLPLVPPLGDANASDFEDVWGSILNDDGWSVLDEKLIVRDTLANTGNYTPYTGALYWATDSGKPVLEGDGSSWDTISVEFADVVASLIDVDDVTAGTVTVSSAPVDPSDVARKQETDALQDQIDTLDTDKLDSVNYTPVTAVDGEVSVAAASVSGLDSAVDSNDSDISALQSNKLDSVNYTPETDTHDRYADSEAVNAIETTTQLSLSGTLSMGTNMVEFVDQNHYIQQGSGGVSGIDGPEIGGWKGVTLVGKENNEVLLKANSSGTVEIPSGGVDLTGDLTDGSTVIWDASEKSIESTLLSADSVSIAGRSVSLGGSTNIAHGDLTSISEDQHHTKSHDHSEADISAVTNAGLSNSSVTVAGNSISLGGSSAIAHADLSSVGTDNHHARDHDHSEQGVSTVGNQGLTNYQVTVAGNAVALGASTSIAHADLGSIGAGDHHAAHEHPGDQVATSNVDVGGYDITNVSDITGQYATHNFGGSSYNIDLTDSTVDARYRNTSGNSIIWFRESGNVEIPNGELSEQGDRIATRTWANNNLGGVSGDDPIPHPVYTTESDVPALDLADVVFVDGEGLYVEHNGTTLDSDPTPLQEHADTVDAHHIKYTDSEASNAAPVQTVNGETGAVTVDGFSGSHLDLTDIGTDDHHAKYTDSEAASAAPIQTVNGETGAVTVDGFSGSHLDLTDIGTDDHHAKYTDSEASSAAPIQTVNGETGDVLGEFNGHTVYISDTEPTGASQGDVWIDNSGAFN